MFLCFLFFRSSTGDKELEKEAEESGREIGPKEVEEKKNFFLPSLVSVSVVVLLFPLSVQLFLSRKKSF